MVAISSTRRGPEELEDIETRAIGPVETERWEAREAPRGPPTLLPPPDFAAVGSNDPTRPLRVVAAERYAEFSLIGRGGMGVVYLALDREMNRRVALKVLRVAGAEPAGLEDPFRAQPPPAGTPAFATWRDVVARFLQEAFVTGGLEHPGVVPVYEISKTPAGLPFYTMRYVRGRRTLETAIEEATGLEDRLALLEPFLKVCETVDYAHARGVIHRDLKPANVGLGEFGEVVVFDWGLAKLLDGPDLQAERFREQVRGLRLLTGEGHPAAVFGTPGYLSPEAVFGGPDEVDKRSDVYSLGVVLYRILTGRLPFAARTLEELAPKLVASDPPPATEADPAVPAALARVCEGALARSPARRTASVSALADAVRTWRLESSLERELDVLVREAKDGLASAHRLEGIERLRRIEGVLKRAGRVLEILPGDAEAGALVREARAAR